MVINHFLTGMILQVVTPVKAAGWLHDLSSHPTLPKLPTGTLDVKKILQRSLETFRLWKKKDLKNRLLKMGCSGSWMIEIFMVTLWWLKPLGMFLSKNIWCRIILYLKRLKTYMDAWFSLVQIHTFKVWKFESKLIYTYIYIIYIFYDICNIFAYCRQ